VETKAAFDSIVRKLGATPGTTVVGSHFDERLFGDFWVTYECDTQRSSIVNDRGQLILVSGPADGNLREVLLQDLYTAEEEAVFRAIP